MMKISSRLLVTLGTTVASLYSSGCAPKPESKQAASSYQSIPAPKFTVLPETVPLTPPTELPAGVIFISSDQFKTYYEAGQIRPRKLSEIFPYPVALSSSASSASANLPSDLDSTQMSASDFISTAEFASALTTISQDDAGTPFQEVVKDLMKSDAQQDQFKMEPVEIVVKSISASIQKIHDVANLNNHYRNLHAIHNRQKRRMRLTQRPSAGVDPQELKDTSPERVSQAIEEITQQIQVEGNASSTPHLSASEPQPVTASTDPSPNCENLSSTVCKNDEQGASSLGFDHSTRANADATLPCQPVSLIHAFSFPLKKAAPCVKDQGSRGSCTAFATVAAAETYIAQYPPSALPAPFRVNLSEQSLYSFGKGVLDTTWPTKDGFNSLFYLQTKGYIIPFESSWNYNYRVFTPAPPTEKRPSPCALQSSSSYTETCSNTPSQSQPVCTQTPDQASLTCGLLGQVRDLTKGAMITNYVSLWNGGSQKANQGMILSMIAFLANQDHPIPLIIETILTNDVMLSDTGYIPYPPTTRQLIGGHAMEVVGFVSNSEIMNTKQFDYTQNSVLANYIGTYGSSQTDGFFIIKNSWSPHFGDHGYYYFPARYIQAYATSVIAVTGVDLYL